MAEQVVKSAPVLTVDEKTDAARRPIARFLKKAMNERQRELESDPNRIAWSNFAIALLDNRVVDLRVVDLQAAHDWIEVCLAFQGNIPSRDASCRCQLAVILWKQGKPSEARDMLKSSKSQIDAAFSKNLPTGDRRSYWFDWVIALILYRKARSLIGE